MTAEKVIRKKEECKSVIGLNMYMLDDIVDQSDLMERIILYFT